MSIKVTYGMHFSNCTKFSPSYIDSTLLRFQQTKIAKTFEYSYQFFISEAFYSYAETAYDQAQISLF